VRAHLGTPQPDLLGQTLAKVILTERAETWVSVWRSQTRRRRLAAIANRLLHPAELPAVTAADRFPRQRADWKGLRRDSGNLTDRVRLVKHGEHVVGDVGAGDGPASAHVPPTGGAVAAGERFAGELRRPEDGPV